MPIFRFSELNWRRGLAEISLIFIGITLALLFDNWNEDRKERALEHQLLSEVLDDLVETRSDLEIDIQDSRRRLVLWRDMAAALVDDAPLGPEWTAMLAETIDFSVLVPKTSGYRSLTSQGLGILSDPELRKAITDFYELRLERVALFEALTFPNYNDRYLPFIQNATRIPDDYIRETVGDHPILPRVEDYKLTAPVALRDDPRLAHLLFQMSSDTRLVLFNYERSRDEVDALIELIRTRLESAA